MANGWQKINKLNDNWGGHLNFDLRNQKAFALTILPCSSPHTYLNLKIDRFDVNGSTSVLMGQSYKKFRPNDSVNSA
jgi:hypothetical protein